MLARVMAARESFDAAGQGSARSIVAVEPSEGSPVEIAMTADRHVAIAFTAPSGATVIPIELRMITASVLRDASVARGQDVSSQDIVLVVCRTDEESLRRWFIRVALGLLHLP